MPGSKAVRRRRFSLTLESTASRVLSGDEAETNGTLDLKYGAEQVFSGEGIGYVPIAGNFGFGAGTEEVTSANRDNHWIDDLDIVTTVASGVRVAT